MSPNYMDVPTCDISAQTIWQSWKLTDGICIVGSLESTDQSAPASRHSHTSNIALTSTTLPSPLLPRSPDLELLPRTTISLGGPAASLEFWCFTSAAVLWPLASCISGAPSASGGMKVCSLRVLRCLFAFGCARDPSFDSGLCLRREERTEEGGGFV